ncbi:MAG: hypothetical protein QOI63_338 [Thermoplasmata archaeon]|jgi:hypothetical protein|nr:hypothetical protein [Thermoplasmata archaeon]
MEVSELLTLTLWLMGSLAAAGAIVAGFLWRALEGTKERLTQAETDYRRAMEGVKDRLVRVESENKELEVVRTALAQEGMKAAKILAKGVKR